MEPFQQNVSYQTWYENYKWQDDNDVYDTFKRVAKTIASSEKDKIKWTEEYYNLLSSFKYIPAGRIISNAGTNLKNTTLINCFVSGFIKEDQDSIKGIYDELQRQAHILKSEGGYGCNFDVLRPRGAYINGIGSETPGPIEIMNLWDTSSNVITKGSGTKNSKKGKNKNRKGAMAATFSCWHPSIEEFIIVKQQPNTLEHFNLSVLITDDFIEAIKNNKKWQLIFPDTDFNKYDKEWDGNIKKWKEKNYPVKVYKEYKNANELWNLIIESTYNRNEPGVIFIDRYNDLNNLKYTEVIRSINPCGEQGLPIGGSCCLGSINLTQYIKDNDWDYESLKKDIPIIVRLQDSIIDLTNYPLKEQKKEALSKRRIGIGYMGYGSSLIMMKIAYGSKKALEITEKLCKFITNNIYKTSSELAKEKGCFSLYDKDRYLKSKFIKQALTENTIALIKKNGIRNSHLTTLAPTGNCLTKNTKIRTKEGIFSIENIFKKYGYIDIEKLENNTWIYLDNPIEIENFEGKDKITKLYVNGKINTKKIILKNNIEFEGSFNHKVLVKINDNEADWIELKDLKPGMKIIKKII